MRIFGIESNEILDFSCVSTEKWNENSNQGILKWSQTESKIGEVSLLSDKYFHYWPSKSQNIPLFRVRKFKTLSTFSFHWWDPEEQMVHSGVCLRLQFYLENTEKKRFITFHMIFLSLFFFSYFNFKIFSIDKQFEIILAFLYSIHYNSHYYRHSLTNPNSCYPQKTTLIQSSLT